MNPTKVFYRSPAYLKNFCVIFFLNTSIVIFCDSEEFRKLLHYGKNFCIDSIRSLRRSWAIIQTPLLNRKATEQPFESDEINQFAPEHRLKEACISAHLWNPQTTNEVGPLPLEKRSYRLAIP
ncbi:hypothetical protein TNCT_501151 [Trichonephila clavata]|uniref:Uncharacterized protein n=1 Tax=Trichonephila clavata TaxID=2740835 RepID=A0A8X6KEE3_TRICU|nr:hypothetical protein TNCT_501151 [Trichonephila clavata]